MSDLTNKKLQENYKKEYSINPDFTRLHECYDYIKYLENKLITLHQANESDKQHEQCSLGGVGCSDLPKNEKMHYDSLVDCCNQLLDAEDIGTVPKRSILGLRILLNRK